MATSKTQGMAKQILETLDWISLYFPAVASEMERVLNLGIPLANLIKSGLVRTVTPEGLDSMYSTDQDLILVRAILEDMPDLANSIPALWDEADSRKREASAGWSTYQGGIMARRSS